MQRSDDAYVPPEKLTRYLLSESHPVGSSKAEFFRLHGYNETNLELLERGLLEIAQNEPVRDVVSSPYGMKFVIEGTLATPSGFSIQVVTVWIIESESDRPGFVTAYPA
jgi:hypothetical protein